MVYPSLRKNVLGLICLVITAVFFLAGLWPFNFSPKNRVRWLQDQNGVQFYGQAIIFSQIPTPYSLHPTPYTLHPFSIELWLQPTPEESSHMGHIFSILDEQGSETFFVGQWRSHLLLGKGIHGKKTYREIGIRDALKKGDKRFVAITSGADGTNIYVDGILMKSSPRFHLFSMNEKPSGKTLLGNSSTGGEYWTGNLLSLAIYDRVLTGEEVSQHFPQHFPQHSPNTSTVRRDPGETSLSLSTFLMNIRELWPTILLVTITFSSHRGLRSLKKPSWFRPGKIFVSLALI